MKTNLSQPFMLSSHIAVLLAVGSLALASSARATDYVSASSGNWSTTTVWDPNGIPGAGDSVVIQSGHLVTNTSGGLTIGSVVIASGGKFSVGAGTTVDSLLNNGTLSVGNNTSVRTLGFIGNFTNNGTINTASTGPYHSLQFFGTDSAWLGSGDISGVKATVTVMSGASLDISRLTSPLKFKSAGTVGMTVNGTLITGTQVISGNGNATSFYRQNSGATLVTANPNGIHNGTSGTLNIAATPVFESDANFVFNGTEAQVTAGLPGTVYNLTITNAAGVTLSAATTVNGLLALDSGVLTTTSGTTPTATVVAALSGSYVSGPLALVYYGPGAQTFPVGKGGNQRPVSLNYTAMTSSSTVTVEQFETAMGGIAPAGTTPFGSRYWTVSQSGGGMTYDLTLDGTGFTPTAAAVILEQGAPDTSYSTTFSSPNYTATGLATFGNFTLGNYALGASQLVFTTGSQTLTAGVVSGPITVQLRNPGGSPLTTKSNLTVTLSTTSGDGVFRDSGDTATITSVTIVAGSNSASFKYKDTFAPAMPTVTASTTGEITPAMQLETINVAPASKLVFTTQPASGNFNYPLATVVVQVEDQYGNLVPQSGTAIILTLNNGGSAALAGANPMSTDATGAAVFSDLTVATTTPRLGLNLTAASPGLTSALSSTFDITSRIIVKARNSTVMSLGGGWVGDVVPGTNDTAQFDNVTVGSAASTYTADIGGDASWFGIRVEGWTAVYNYTVKDDTGGYAVTLGTGGLVGANLTRSITFSNAFALGADQGWIWGGPGSGNSSLNLSGNINNAGHHLTINATQPVNLNADLSGAGSLTKSGPGTLSLRGSVSYTGETVVSNGVLVVSGTLDGSSKVTVAGGTLGGSGIISGPVTVNAEASLAPGTAVIGTLTVNQDLTLNGNTLMDFSNSGADYVAVIGHLKLGGTLTVITNGVLTGGESFQLFFATSYSGDFTTYNLPALPAPLGWDTSQMRTTGFLSVISVVAPTDPIPLAVARAGNVLTFSWTDAAFKLQSQTNALSVGLQGNWFDYPGGASSPVNVTIDPATPTVYFRLVAP